MDNLTAVRLTLTTERLERAIERLRGYYPRTLHPQTWRTLNAELERRKLGATEHPIVIARRHLVDLPFAVQQALQVG